MMRAACFALLLCAAPALAQSGAADPRALVSSSRAVDLFAAVCGDSLPEFESAAKRMLANGIDHVVDSKTVHSSRENLSFKLMDGPGVGATCSMVFATDDDVTTFVTEAFRLGQFQETALGLAAPYRNSVVILGSRPVEDGNVTYHNIRLLSER